MDKPARPDLNPYDLIDEVPDASDDECNDSEEGGNHNGDGEAAKDRPERPQRRRAQNVSKFPHGDSMYQRFIEFCVSLVTPPKNASPEELRRHAISLSIAIALNYLSIAIAYGWFSSIGLSGFARANDLAVLQAESAESRVTLYSMGIREYHLLYCNTTSYADQVVLNDRVQRLRAQYDKAVGVPYVLPACPPRP